MGEKINPELELAININNYTSGSSLYIGYNTADDSWTLILRYSGDIHDLEMEYLNKCIYLLGGFAIIEIYTYNIDRLLRDPRILYIDKANYFSYGSVSNSYEKLSMCITNRFNSRYDLTGAGVCVGIIDSGLDLRNQEFYSDDKLRVILYWNQNELYNEEHPNDYKIGRIYNERELDDDNNREYISEGLFSVHGTEVASASVGNNTGIAYGSSVIVVEQYGGADIPDTISIMMGIDFLVRYSMSSGVPLVINLSYGNNYGAHDGNSTLELFIDVVSQMSKVNVVTGTGNDGDRSLHTSGILGNVSFKDIDIAVYDGVNNFGLQVWKNYTDNFDLLVYSPSYDLVMYITDGQITQGVSSGTTHVYGIFQSPTPYNTKQLIYIYFSARTYIETGVWHVRIIPKSIINGVYNAYIPGSLYITGVVAFETPAVYGTLSIPSSARSAISVAAYDQREEALTSFSGRGFTTDNAVKPDIAAPGVGVTVSIGRGEYALADGTSISSALVSGCAALLMEWGIVRGNDPFMYGERLKAQLIRGAVPLRGLDMYPNRFIGWGTVCMDKSFEGLD